MLPVERRHRLPMPAKVPVSLDTNTWCQNLATRAKAPPTRMASRSIGYRKTRRSRCRRTDRPASRPSRVMKAPLLEPLRMLQQRCSKIILVLAVIYSDAQPENIEASVWMWGWRHGYIFSMQDTTVDARRTFVFEISDIPVVGSLP